ncbi:hypothetical protein C8K15_101451 [Paenisporosarcina sp. OV554]|nr:hypothetical protein C8K15_101451 [Paenisporosarcina sp. OV554]
MDSSSLCSTCKQRKEGCKCSHEYNREKQKIETTCFVETHDFNSGISQPCNGSTKVIFEDLTNNHNKTMIQALSIEAPCIPILIIETKDGRPPIERTLEFLLGINIEVENVKRVSVRCQGNPTGTCSVIFFIQKTFCICCPIDSISHRC